MHGPFVDDGEVEAVANFLRQQGEPEYDDRVVEEIETVAELTDTGEEQAMAVAFMNKLWRWLCENKKHQPALFKDI